ncbi:MAG: hypothetical protein ACOYL6_16405 [Bacteriovoracaceae bacterium]
MLKILILIPILYSFSSFAEERMEGIFPSFKVSNKNETNLQMGINGGVNSPRGAENNSTSELGATIAYQPFAPIGIGADVSTSRFQKSEDENYRRITALARATYNLGGTIPVLNKTYIGAGTGPVFLKGRTEWALAPLAGFDIPLTNKAHNYVSLGLNEKFLAVTNAPNAWITTAAVKYWF